MFVGVGCKLWCWEWHVKCMIAKARNCTALAASKAQIIVQPLVCALTEINKANMFEFPKMFHDSSEGFCVWGCFVFFLSPHKAFWVGSATEECLSDSSYHCFSFTGQIFNDLWWSGSQLALAHAKTAHPPLFLLGDVEVPSPVPFVGVVREDKRKEMCLSVAAPALVYFLAAAYGLSSREQSYAGWGFSIWTLLK